MLDKSFKKFGHTGNSIVREISPDEFQSKLASEDVLGRLNKFAQTIKAIAPRSDDFLYFSIIFLKSAEASLIDESGNLKKVGKDNAWGYFDDSWKWHGNVKPHKNNNGDIFPESELKKATRNWIGRPLCVDHKSDTVDGVRGIILDTHYDEKLKQVVGLCALDKINYPDLARKVTTGVVRYGSMGTAVSTSICTECSKPATTPKEYCDHIIRRQAWGEINVGLNPIEYSLVVQPAEPGAILLRCFASIGKHKEELSSYGFDTETMLTSLDEAKANGLDLLLNSVCGSEGCSLDQRQRIVKGYLNTDGFTKSASTKVAYDKVELAKAMSEFASATGKTMEEAPELFKTFFDDDLQIAGEDLSPLGETLTSGDNASGADTITNKNDGDVSDYTGTGSSGLVAGVTEPNPDSFKGDGVGPESYAFSKAKTNDSIKLSSILEDIMDETTLRKRAALRRRLAYPQGGAAPAAEPNTYKDEGALQKKIREQDDKHMHPNPTSLGGPDGMAPGDKEKKTKLLRAEENLQNKKRAYFQGGSAPAIEPSTFTSEDYHKYWDTDKHMHQTKPMGGDKGMFPGDEAVKQVQKRAKYKGPALSTKLKQLRTADGSINKAASGFEVYSGGKLVIATTAKTIFGEALEDNWDFLTSREYAKAVIAAIREDGLGVVGQNLTKSAQEMPEMPGMADAGMEAPMDDPMAEMPEELPMEEDMGAEGSPKSVIEDALVGMEDNIEKVRGALGSLGGEDVDVNINVGEGTDLAEMPEEKMALSKSVFNQLKVVLADAKDSADELALLAETYERFGKLSSSQRKDLSELSSGALRDYSAIVGSSKALVSVAKTISQSMVKVSEYVEGSKTTPKVSAKDSLIASAMDLRKQRRQALLKKAQEALAEMPEEACADDAEVEEKENEAHDGIGMKENAQVAGVASDTAQDVATRAPSGGDHKASPSKGNQDANQHANYSGTPSRQVAESGTPSPNQEHAADDGDTDVAENEAADQTAEHGKDMGFENKADDAEDVAEEAAEEEVEEHEEEMHGKESDAQDELSAVQSKLNQSFINKKAEDEREAYRVRLRRAYDVGMEMQRKGMLAKTRPALNSQVDNMMEFDDKAFEAFKRTVANAQGHSAIKVASDVGGINIGVTNEDGQTTVKTASDINAKNLATMWD